MVLSSRCTKAFAVSILSCCLHVFAEEVDDFSAFGQLPKEDSTNKVNLIVNDQLKLLESQQQSSSTGECNKKDFMALARERFNKSFSEIGKRLRNSTVAEDGKAINSSGKDLRLNISIKAYPLPDDGIYEDTSTQTACCIERIKIKNIGVGLDKVDHFFGNGGILFFDVEEVNSVSPLNQQQKDSLALKLSTKQETGTWGLGYADGGGVKSYGDLVANWEGYKFWTELIGGTNPYFKCENGKYKLIRNFDIGGHVNYGWNEAINCSSYLASEAPKVLKNMKASGYKCPMAVELCRDLVKSYSSSPEAMNAILSPKCIRPEKEFSFVEAPTSGSWYEELQDTIKGMEGVSSDQILKFAGKKLESFGQAISGTVMEVYDSMIGGRKKGEGAK